MRTYSDMAYVPMCECRAEDVHGRETYRIHYRYANRLLLLSIVLRVQRLFIRDDEKYLLRTFDLCCDERTCRSRRRRHFLQLHPSRLLICLVVESMFGLGVVRGLHVDF